MFTIPNPYDLLIGLDRSDKKADLYLIDTHTGHQWFQTIDTAPEALHEWLTQLRQQYPQARVAIILEQPALNLIGFLESVDWITLYAINPITLQKFREAFVTSRAKDDAKDAQYLAELLLTHQAKLKVWVPEDPQTRLLQQLVCHRRAVVDERTGLTNRLQALLKQYYPQALALCGDELWRPLATDFLLKWPTLQKVQKARPETLKQFYYLHGSRSQKLVERRLELVAIYVPDPQDEAVRDLVRARYQVGKQQHRARQQLKMFLLRHNLRYAGTTSWTPKHLRYLATVKLPFPEQQWVFQEMVNVITEAGERLARYDAQLPRALAGWRWKPVVNALMGFRGLARLNAMTLVAELGDLHRFATAPQLMGYLGMVPSEDSTGDERHQGGITKMGNGIARRALIEAAWNYCRPARISRDLLKRQEGLSQPIKDLSWAAQSRLHHRYKHLTGPMHKKKQVAAAALGRELSGFVWAIGQIVAPHAAKGQAAKTVST